MYKEKKFFMQRHKNYFTNYIMAICKTCVFQSEVCITTGIIIY